MCYGSGCPYERPSGHCGKPPGRMCPDGMTEEEMIEEQDHYEYMQEQKYEELRDREFGM